MQVICQIHEVINNALESKFSTLSNTFVRILVIKWCPTVPSSTVTLTLRLANTIEHRTMSHGARGDSILPGNKGNDFSEAAKFA